MDVNPGKPANRPCEGWCKYIGIVTEGPGVLWESSRTRYHWDGTGEDPNRDQALCRECAVDHHEYWDDMWSNVPGYGG